MGKTTLFIVVALTTHAPFCVNAQNAISVGIHTILFESEFGDGHPDNPFLGGEVWNAWDGVNGGGQNHGLLWFDIPQNVLDRFGSGTATLVLQVQNDGDGADVHRVTVDWLSGPDGGDNVTWNNFPGGPGLVPGDNVEEDPSLLTGPPPVREIEFDVTDDVLDWASGIPNYGWGFIPTDAPRLGNGVNVWSFESGRGPVLVLEPGVADILGDFDGDGTLTAIDIDLLSAEIRTPSGDFGFDVNGDGLVNLEDHDHWVTDGNYRNTLIGDADFDGTVELPDFLLLSANFGQDGGWAQGDFNADGIVDFLDFLRQSANFGATANASMAAVPEPTSICLSMFGVLGIIGFRERRWSSRSCLAEREGAARLVFSFAKRRESVQDFCAWHFERGGDQTDISSSAFKRRRLPGEFAHLHSR